MGRATFPRLAPGSRYAISPGQVGQGGGPERYRQAGGAAFSIVEGDVMAGDLDMRRRRAAYRAAHRGTKEMDILLGRYAGEMLQTMTDPDLASFEELLEASDTDLQRWIMRPGEVADPAYARWVGKIKRFHGLGAEA
jgi:antitoxin CptB